MNLNPEDLRQPLRRRGLRERLVAMKPSGLATASLVTVVAVAAAGGWAMRQAPVPKPLPSVTVKLETADPIITSSTAPDEAGLSADGEPDGQAMEESPYDPSNEVIDLDLSQDDGAQGAALINPMRQRLAAAPIASVSEKGPHGPLPKISKSGKQPWLIYAAKADASVLASTTPKVAIVLGGMGLNDKLTQKAIEELPGEVTLAFAPYGNRLQQKVNQARHSGHEVLLQLPMEPFGYPGVDPGPRTLLTGAAPAETMDRLKWHMSRFAGYSGIVNYLGAKFTSDGESLAPVMRELKTRGLIYLDDGSSNRSMAPALGQVIGVPVRTSVEVIDGEPNFNAISAALARLEAQAAQEGFAIGTGTGLDVTIEALKSWQRDLSARNIMLVPATATYRGLAG